MRTIHLWSGLAMLAILGAGPSFAAGPFDGNWIGQVPPVAGCAGNARASLTLIVNGTEVTGVLRNLGGRVAVVGTVDKDGKGSVHVARNYGTLQFSGDKFAMVWEAQRGCTRRAEGTREAAPSP